MSDSFEAQMVLAHRQWVCIVNYSGYHNGVNCRPSDPHGSGWDCGWYYKAPLVKAPAPRIGAMP